MRRIARHFCALRGVLGALAWAAGSGLALPAAAPAVTLDPGAWTSTLRDRVGDAFTAVESVTSPLALPGAGTSAGATFVGSTAQMDYALSDAAFEIGFDHAVTPDVYAGGQGMAFLYFSVAADTPYQLSGHYQVAASDEPWRLYFAVTLQDITGAPLVLFHSLQVSSQTPGEILSVGQLGGDEQNQLSGASSGTLLAGHRYRFYATAYVEGYPVFPRAAPASASGSVSLLFVPEPSTALLVGAGLAGLGARRRRAGASAAPRRGSPGSGAVLDQAAGVTRSPQPL